MDQEKEFALGRYSLIIGLVIVTSVLILWMKPRTRTDCAGFRPQIFAKACLAELPAANYPHKPMVTPPFTPPLVINLARLEFTEVKLEPEGAGKEIRYVLSGNLKNRSTSNLKDIQMLINYYNFGDDPDKVPPIAHYDLKIKELLPAGQVKPIRQLVSDSNMNLPNTSFSWNWRIVTAAAVESPN